MSPSHLSSLEKKQSNSSFLSHNLCNTENVCAFTNVVLRFRSILICSLCLSLGEIPLNPFCSFRRSKYDILMEYVSNLLQQSPGQFATLISLKEQLVSISLRVSVGLCVFALSVCDNKCAFFFQNVNDGTFKRVFQYMRTAKLVEFCQYPLEDLDPSAGPCTNKKGNVPLKHQSIYGLISQIYLICSHNNTLLLE